MRIAYGRLGSPFNAEIPSPVKGDIEVMNLLRRLVLEDHVVDVVTPHVGALPARVWSQWSDTNGAFYNVPRLTGRDRDQLCDGGAGSSDRLREFESEVGHAIHALPEYDAWVIWMGEHNGPCWPMPLKDGTGLCRPYTSRINFVHPLIAVLNARGIAPVWLCPDPRNLLKCDNYRKDLIGTRPILAQFDTVIRGSAYHYAGLELLAIGNTSSRDTGTNADRAPFGAMLNEGSKDERPLSRKKLVVPWVTALGGELVGSWREETCAELGIERPATVPVKEVQRTVARWKSTIALPASGTGWATAKAWEAFAAGTVCFAHPAYDSQDHIYRRLSSSIRQFLRPGSPGEFAQRVRAVDRSAMMQRDIITEQWKALGAALTDDHLGVNRVLREASIPV